MKKFLRSVAAVAAAAAVTVSGAAYYAPTAAPDTIANVAAADDNNDDWLHAEGSRLYDMNGKEVWITGANWFGFNCSENCAHGLYARDVDDMLQSIADHGINTLRLPISSELLVSWMNGKPNPVSSVQASYNPPQDVVGEDGTITPAGKYGDINRDFVESDGKTLKNSMEIFDIIMQKCKKYGIKVFIDVHSPDANNSGHNYELWYGKAGVTTKVWIDSLTWIAEKYSNDDTLIGYDLKNEPHGKRGYKGDECPSDIAKWDDSKDENNWAYAAKQCADSILKVNPHALIFIEGIEQYPMIDKGYTFDTPDVWEPKTEDEKRWYGAWWGGNLRGVRKDPVVPESGTSQIVYSPHDYGPSVYAQTWFDKDFTTQTLLDDYWYDTWAYINKEEIAPLLIGEWGGHMDKGKNQKWMELLRDYMIANHINHTFWCINPNSGDTGGLLDPTFMNWDDNKYSLFEKSLWQTDAGKYIGLDHQTALGKNGLSLSEFYASGAKSNLDAGAGSTPGHSVTTQPPKATTTTTTSTTTSTTTTTAPVTTTTTTTAPVISTQEYYIFKDVASYPTKTVYTEGESLDLSGLVYNVSNNSGTENKKIAKTDLNDCTIIDSTGVSNNANDLSKLGAGKYTVKLSEQIGSYYTNDLIKGVDVSFEITVSSKVPGTSDPGTDKPAVVWGDTNGDGKVELADAILIMQALANPDKYGENGSYEKHLTAQGKLNGDVDKATEGLTSNDSLFIQEFLLKKRSTLDPTR